MKNIVSFVTFCSLVSGLILAIIWFITDPKQDYRFEPALTAIGLLATLTGIFAERWASVKEERRVILLALYREFQSNKVILSDTRFHLNIDTIEHPVVYPRLIMSVTEAAIASGVFAEQKYRDLFWLLHQWRDIVNEFNRRLDITELRTFVEPSPPEIREFYRALRESNSFNDAVEFIYQISNILKSKHLNKQGHIQEIEMIEKQLSIDTDKYQFDK
ncbi:MAG: hypothetical protein AAFX46_09450 [Cyanobacteria bacterium J06636_27]